MRDAYVTRLKHMCLSDFDMQILGLIMRFNIDFDRLNIDGLHTTHANMINGIITIPISGQGTIHMDINNVRVNAIGQLATLPNGNLFMQHLVSTVVVGTVDASLSGFGALDGTISRLISSAAPGMVNDSQDQINESMQAILIPALNRFLGQHTILTLVNLMAERNQSPPSNWCQGEQPRTCP